MKKQFLLNVILSVLWIVAACALAFRVYSLRFDPPQNAILFWLPYMVLISISAYLSLTKRGYTPFIVTLALAFVLHSINVLREPGNINWGKDAVHDLQIAVKGLAAGHFVFGDPTFVSHSFDQSFYPGQEFLLSSLSLVSKIPLTTLYNYTFVPLNLLTLLFFFFLMRRLFKNQQIANISVLLYVLAPRFNSFNSSALHESLAIIFYPLVLLPLLTQDSETSSDRRMLVPVILSAILITITNEWTMYVLTFDAFIIVVTYFVTGGRQRTKLMLLFLLVTLVLSWLSFIATFFLRMHTRLIEHILSTVASSEKGTSVSTYSLPFLEFAFSYAGFGLIFMISAIGICQIVRSARRRSVGNPEKYALIMWWIANVGIAVLFQVIPWQNIGESPIRLRSMEFAYFGIAPFAALGIHKLITLKSRFLRKFLRNDAKQLHINQIVGLTMLAVIAIPTITVGFNTPYYDNPPPRSYVHLNPIGSYFAGSWLSQYSASTMIVGTRDGEIFVSGYAQKVFSYSQFKKSIQNHTILAYIYFVNLDSVHIEDDFNFSLGMDNLLWLESRLSRVYDNGPLIILIENNQSQTP